MQRISPYLDDLLKKWGRNANSSKPWHSICPMFQPFADTTTRAPVLSTGSDDVEMIGLEIQVLAESLRKALEARYKYQRMPLRTDKARAKWARQTTHDYKRNLSQAIRQLEVKLDIAV